MVNNVTILIADDDDGHAILIQENLEDAGVNNPMIRFRDGQEVWDYLSGQGPGPHIDLEQNYLLLLDIRMPKMDGVDVLRNIKQTKKLHSIPVIMLTTTDSPKEVAECYELGCNSYIAKPINIDAFQKTINHLGMFIELMIVTSPQNAINTAP